MNEKVSNLVAMFPDSTRASQIKGACLAKYADRQPRRFLQIDCFGPNAAGDCVIDRDCTGKGMMGGATWELMRGTPIRILIGDDYDDPQLLADMLIEAAEWVRSDPDLLKLPYEYQKEQEAVEPLPF